MGPNVIPADKKKQLIDQPWPEVTADYLFAEVTLKGQQLMSLRQGKEPQLRPCACIIPLLPKAEPISLNHAFTLLSMEFETERKSHSGNVFQRGYVVRKDRWLNLHDLRDRGEWRPLQPSTQQTQ
ncbi:MAG: hypothetical protein L0219_09420 [Phycisphaerales bacterium]|nr:hypothetical protein [Phycisphaerales bacterium]MCI0674409.1 hypothetical protein [Phycisphaerales bacterium]